jgi:CheY-like chemotaxis protein
MIHRILILDSDQPLREQLTETLRRTPNTEVSVVAGMNELVLDMKYGLYAAVFVDGDLLGGDASRLIAAVRSCLTRPMLVIASNEKAEDLDPDFVTLVVRKPYDVLMVTGVLLAAVTGPPGDAAGDADAGARTGRR